MYPTPMWFALAVALLAPGTGQVVIDCPQYGRTVAVDRRPVGQTPLDPIDLAAGFHWVEVLDGNEPLWSRLIYVSPGVALEVVVSLPDAQTRRRHRASPTKPEAKIATTYSLTGRAGVMGAALGDARQLGLDQRWRLDARDIGGRPLDAHLEATVYTALDDEADASVLRPRYAWPSRPTVLTTATLTHRRPRHVISIGRHRPIDPTGVPYLLDGVKARTHPRPWLSVTSTFGRRALEPNLEYTSHLVTGLRAEGVHNGGKISLFGLYHDGLYLGAEAAQDVGPVAFSSRVQRVGEHVARLESRARWRHDTGSIWLEGAFRRQTDGGFERPLLYEDPLSPPALREIRAHLGGELTLAALTLEGALDFRHGQRQGAQRSPNVTATRLAARWGHRSMAPAAEFVWREHEEFPIEGPALERVVRGRVSGRLGPCRLALGWVTLAVDTETAHHPEGHAKCAAPITSPLYVFGRIAHEAVHPQIQPTGGPLLTWWTGLELR